MRGVAGAMAALLLGLTGAGLLLAAACLGLVPVLGGAGALAVTGLGCLVVLALGLALRGPRRPAPVQDPLAQMLFDLSFTIGQSLRRR